MYAKLGNKKCLLVLIYRLHLNWKNMGIFIWKGAPSIESFYPKFLDFILDLDSNAWLTKPSKSRFQKICRSQLSVLFATKYENFGWSDEKSTTQIVSRKRKQRHPSEIPKTSQKRYHSKPLKTTSFIQLSRTWHLNKQLNNFSMGKIQLKLLLFFMKTKQKFSQPFSMHFFVFFSINIENSNLHSFWK